MLRCTRCRASARVQAKDLPFSPLAIHYTRLQKKIVSATRLAEKVTTKASEVDELLPFAELHHGAVVVRLRLGEVLGLGRHEEVREVLEEGIGLLESRRALVVVAVPC